jgi:Ca-activated chloride channel family protein
MQAENKLPLLISSFQLLVGQLRPQDRISLVTYAGASAVVLEGKSGRYRSEIVAALEELKAGGSTAGAQGIVTAYDVAKKYFIEGGNNRVVLATDGDFNIGVSSDGDLVRLIEKQRESGIFLSVLGFGMGNYKDNKMQKLADHGNGNHNYIDNLTEAKKVFVNEFGGSLYTVAKDVKIQVEFNPKEVAGYRLVGYENRKLENRDFEDDKKDAGEMGVGHTVTALYEIIPVGIESDWLVAHEKRYSRPADRSKASLRDEMAYLKVRYKDPQGSKSKVIEQPIKSTPLNAKISENFNWAASVAGFGMLLRDSEFKQNATLEDMLHLAEENKGKDEYGYRAEFIYLIQKFREIDKPLPVDEEVSNR